MQEKLDSIIIVSERKFIEQALRHASFYPTVITVSTAKAIEHLSESIPQIVILDDYINSEYVEQLEQLRTHIISISQHPPADLVKPFHISKLVQMIEWHLNIKRYYIADCYFFPTSRTVINHSTNESILLREKESQLLEYFILHKGIGISSRELLQSIWGYKNELNTATVEVHIYRLRRKLDTIGLRGYLQLLHKRYIFSNTLNPPL